MPLPFFVFTELYFLSSAVVTEIVTPIAELVIPIKIAFQEAKAGIETHPEVVEIIISECSI